MMLWTFMVRTALEQNDLPNGWQVYFASCGPPEAPVGFTKLKGCVPELFKSGPRKGKPNWKRKKPDTEFQVFVSDADVQANQDKWECETGKCPACEGSMKELASVSVATGATYRPCRMCKGSGRSQREIALK